MANKLSGSSLPIDTGWAWMIAFGCCVLQLLSMGGVKSYGVIHAEFMRHDLHMSERVIMVQATTLSLYSASTVFGVFLQSKIGFRQALYVGSISLSLGYFLSACVVNSMPILMYLTYGCFVGVGTTLLTSVSTIALKDYFSNHLTLAMCIAFTGSSIGTFVWSYIFRGLIDAYGMKMAFVICSGIVLNALPVSGLIRPISWYTSRNIMDAQGISGETTREIQYGTINNDQIAPEHSSTRTISGQNLMSADSTRSNSSAIPSTSSAGNYDVHGESENPREKYYITSITNAVIDFFVTWWRDYISDWSLTLLISSFNFTIISIMSGMTLLPVQGVTIGLDKYEISTVLAVFGATDFLGRIAIGLLADITFFHGRRILIYGASCIIFGVGSLLAPFASDVITLSSYAVCVGLFGMNFFAIMPVIIFDMYGPHKYAKVFGYAMTCFALTGFSTAYVNQYLNTTTGDWTWSFRLTGFSSIAACLVLLIQSFVDKWSRSRNRTHSISTSDSDLTSLVLRSHHTD